MTGAEIVHLMEDVADNLFHPDPYYRQGGDMVRVGGLTYAIDPARSRSAAASATSAWAAARSSPPGATGPRAGPRSARPTARPAWDVVAEHLRALKRVRLDPRPRVRVL